MTLCLPLWSLVFQKEIWRGFEKTQFVSLSWKITKHKHKSMNEFKTGFPFESRNFSLQKKRYRRASRKLSRTRPWRYSHWDHHLHGSSSSSHLWIHQAMDKEMLFKYQISALSILRPSRASTSGLYIPSRLWRKLATQFSSVKPLEARSPQSRGSRTRCPSTSRPTPDWAWWSKVNYEVRRRWQFGRFYIRIPLNILSNFLENNRYFNCSCFV